MVDKCRARPCLNRAISVVLNSKAELIILFFSTAYYMPTAFIQNLIIQKLCLRQNYPKDYCLSNAINETLEDSMQAEVAQLLLYYYLFRQVPAIVLALFMGQWCDKYGRKYVMIIASVGCTISAMLYFVNSWFMEWPPIFTVLSVLPAGLSGGYIIFLLGIYGFLRDVHPVKSLSIRLSTVDGTDCFAQQIGPLIGGQLYLLFGAEGVFLMCAAMLIVSIIFTIVFVKDDRFEKGVDTLVMLRDFFDWRGIVSSVVAVFKKRDGHFRAYILCVLASMFITILSYYGFYEILFLYTRLTVKWDVITFNFYVGIIGGTGAIGSVVLLPLLVSVFHWSDSTLGLIGLVVNVVYYYILAFANTSLIFYAAVSLQVFSMFCYVTFRSIITKCILFSEMGKVMAVYAVVQSVADNVGPILATQIYSHTFRFFPGAFFVFMGSIGLICVALYTCIFIDLRKNRIVLGEIYIEMEQNNLNANNL